MKDDLPYAGWKQRFWFFVGKYKGYVIEGYSMTPALDNGDAVLIDPRAAIAVGNIVLAKHPYKQSVNLVKRVNRIDGDAFFLIGDNESESTDSRTFGPIPRKDILGKVICRLKR